MPVEERELSPESAAPRGNGIGRDSLYFNWSHHNPQKKAWMVREVFTLHKPLVILDTKMIYYENKNACEKSKTKMHAFASIIWIAFFIFSFFYYVEVSSGVSNYKIGDWLINYSGGMVRRGLIGEILYRLSDIGIPLKWLIYSTQMAVYFFIFLLVYKMYAARERGREWLLVLLSPAFILFPFYDFDGGFRKEILVFLSFCILALAYSRNKLDFVSIGLSYVFFVVAGFSHELTVFVLPFYGYIFRSSANTGFSRRRPALAWFLAFFFTSLVFSVYSVVFHGNAEIAEEICNSIISRGFSSDMCGGAIKWLEKDTGQAMSVVYKKLGIYILTYPLLAFYSLVPIILSNWWKRRFVFLLFAGSCFLPLFIGALDWGRWIHIYVFFSFTLMLSESIFHEITIVKVPIVVIILYLTSWSIPHWNAYNSGYGFAAPVLKIYWQEHTG